jgi:hypothetical protein
MQAPWSFVTQIFHNGQPSHSGDRNTFEVMTSNLTHRNHWFSSFLVSSNLYQGHFDRNTLPEHLSSPPFIVGFVLLDL